MQIAAAAEPGSGSEQIQDAKAHITALQEALSKAQNRVSELENELINAHNSIEELENQTAAENETGASVSPTVQPESAMTQTVRGQPLYDEHNPKLAIRQKTVIAEKFPVKTQHLSNIVHGGLNRWVAFGLLK